MGRPNVRVPEALQRDGAIGKRDAVRVPLQWNSSINGGFSRAAPNKLWLPAVDPSIYQHDNLELQARDPTSPYRFVSEILNRRKHDPALHEGGLRMLHTNHDDVLAFARTDPTDPRRQVISVTNFSQNTIPVSLLDALQTTGVTTFSSSHGRQQEPKTVDFTKPIVLAADVSYLIDSTP
jgi:hypothetical protein